MPQIEWSSKRWQVPSQDIRLAQKWSKPALLALPGVRTIACDSSMTYPAAVGMSAVQTVRAKKKGISGLGLSTDASNIGYNLYRADRVSDAYIETPDGSDFTWVLQTDNIGYVGTNPGWFRSSSGSGNMFILIPTAGLWVRYCGSDFTSSVAPPLAGSTVTVVVRIRSGVSLKAWINGVVVLDSATAQTTSGLTSTGGINAFGQHGLSEYVTGTHTLLAQWWHARFNDSDCKTASINPYGQIFEDEEQSIWFPPSNQVIYDAASSSAYESSLSSYSFNHTVGPGNNRVLIVQVSVFATGNATGITYNGVALTQNTSATITNGVYRTETWYLINPASGTHSVAVTLSASLTSIADAVSYYNADQTTPIETVNTASGSNTPAAASVTTIAANSRVVGHLSTATASGVTSAAGQSNRTNNNGALGSSVTDDKGPVVTPASTTLTWNNIGTLDNWAVSVISIRVPTAGGGTTTITAAFGSYLLNGQTSALKDNRLIPSGFGSFALNGKAANLLKSSKTVANFGSFALTGQTISLRNNKLIPLVFGNFTLTGIAAAFNYIKQLTINAGSYALNGQAAILSKAVKLIIDNGLFALNGQASTFSRTHSILSAFGSFVLNGQAVGLLETHRLPIGIGAYALNGQTVALYTSKLFSVAYGGYTLTGQAASFLANRRLSLTVGTYALNGQVATLTKVGLSTLAASSGGYVLNGQLVGLAANRKLSLVNGSYAYTGQSAQLTLIPALLATRGLYVLNGQNITFHQDRRLHANQGAYTLNGIAATLNLQAAYNRSVARTLLVNPENRTFVVNPENRVHTI